MATILITGGTGLIGTALTKELIIKGHDVIILTRRQGKTGKGKGIRYAHWDVRNQTIDRWSIEESDAVIHLAGANVADKRWTEKRKQVIVDSRTQSAALLVKALREIPNKVTAVVSASGIGWYGPDPQVPNPKPFVETDPADDSFLGQTCQQWEGSILPVMELGKRLVIFRTGIVLSNEGGAYLEFKRPMQFGVAPVLGGGRQIISWIHIVDVVRLYVEAVENQEWKGVYNAVAPSPVSNEVLMKTMAQELRSFFIPVPVPEIALKAIVGEMSIEVLKSATVSSQKVEKAGFRFFFPSMEAAVKNLAGK